MNGKTVLNAEKYSKSVAMKSMISRSVPNSVMYKVIDKEKEDLQYLVE